ncbi:unnamed protein product [Clavelina lepadiformis]|uniref:Major facilitator superfamily (MFS) profile domain-containing protein n=2 Tax=Clavelina lepadiformis TaxID=159417 RepID=A0ABP0FB95_CLALP
MSFIQVAVNVVALNPTDATISQFVNASFQHRWNRTGDNEEVGFIMSMAKSMILVGGLVGAFTIKFMLQILSRQQNLTLLHVIFVVSSLLMSVATKFGMSYEALIVGRFLCGFSRGCGFTLVPLMIAETTSRKTIALYQAPTLAILQLGSAISNFLGLPWVLGGEQTWPFFLAMPGFFSIVYLIASPMLPETITYKILEEENVEVCVENQFARPSFNLLKKLRAGNLSTVQNEYIDMKMELSASLRSSQTSFWNVLMGENSRRQLFGAIVILTTLQSTGVQAVALYTDTIFEETGIPKNQATYYTIGMFVLMALVLFASSPLLVQYGARKMILVGLTGAAFSLVLLTVSLKTRSFCPDVMTKVSLTALILYSCFVSFGPMMCFMGFATEVTTQLIRPSAMWIGGIVWNTMASAIVWSTPYILQAIHGYFYLVFVGLVIFDVLYIKFYVPSNTTARYQIITNEPVENFEEVTPLLSSEIFRQEKTANYHAENSPSFRGKNKYYGSASSNCSLPN